MRTLGNQAEQVTGYAREMHAGVGYELKKKEKKEKTKKEETAEASS